MTKIFWLFVLASMLQNTFAQNSLWTSTSTLDNSQRTLSYVVLAKLDSESDQALSEMAPRAGIVWTESLGWQEIQEKARRENKYIFLDCFTTWCGPCKKMDKEVYMNDLVGNFFNDKFISVKVQMDKTKNDNNYIQSWYKDAAEIGRHYLLEGYPTFLFFSPGGIIVHKEMGFANVEKLIALAQTALTPGKMLNDDYAEYMKLTAAYKQGEIQYDRLPFMVNIAKKMGDTVSRALVKTHTEYVSQLNPEKRYSKENIEFWASLNLTSKSRLVQFFFRDSKRIDKVMNKKGYATTQVDKCIQSFTVGPFLWEQYKNPDAKSGVTTFNATTGIVVANAACYDEADWKKLRQLICKEFNSSYVKRNLLQAKVIWYEKNSNWTDYVKTSLKKFKNYPPDFNDWLESKSVNAVGWKTFLKIKDKDLINESIMWMEKLVKEYTNGSFFDTYANLLYKVGRKKEAIQWQEKAVSLDPERKDRQSALEQMEKGKPTYGVTW